MKPLRDTDLAPAYYSGLHTGDLIPPQCRDDETRWPWLQSEWLIAFVIAFVFACAGLGYAMNHITSADYAVRIFNDLAR